VHRDVGKGARDFEPLDRNLVEQSIAKTRRLCEEIYWAMAKPMMAAMQARFEGRADADFDPTASGAAMREAIFYGGESAYAFQYRDFAPARYAADEPWIVAEGDQGYTRTRQFRKFNGHAAWRRIRGAMELGNARRRFDDSGPHEKGPLHGREHGALISETCGVDQCQPQARCRSLLSLLRAELYRCGGLKGNKAEKN
jgi:hypothetical protein